MKKLFGIGKICIDEDGTWWAVYLGNHADQGGKRFTLGQEGSPDLTALFKVVKSNMTSCKDEYLEMIKEKSNEKT